MTFKTAMAIYLFGAASITTSAHALTEKELTDVLTAIRTVESNNNPSAIGDSGNAIGVYQIWKVYHQDAIQYSGIGGKYRDCLDPVYADKVVRAYMGRYATEKRLGRPVTQRDIAVMHNGGPRAVWAKGKKKQNVDKYWAKVQKELNKK